jgi:hypothetical protein
MPYVPGRIGQLGLFREQGVATTSVMIEEKEGSLNLVETTARGAPAIQNTHNKRKARSLVVPHIALEDTILADEVQNVRAFGSESLLEGVQAVVNQRMTEMASKMDATLEHLRIGAIKGQILDADGSAVIYDLFTEFGVSQHTEIDFDLDNGSPAAGAVKKKCHDVRRKIEDELGAQPYDHIHAICGADFFDDLITHSEVATAYERYLDGAFLRQGQARGIVTLTHMRPMMARDRPISGGRCRERPRVEGVSSELLKNGTAEEMALNVEGVVGGGLDRQETLGRTD